MSTRKAFGKMTSRLFEKVRKTYRHQTNQDQVGHVKQIIKGQFGKISSSLNKYIGLTMPALPKDLKYTDFNTDTVLTNRLKTIGQALYGTYLAQTHFRILYGSNYATKTTTGLTPMYVNARHYPFLEDMMTELKLVACPLFGYLDKERVFPPIPHGDLLVVYLDNIHYLCDAESLLIYIPQYSFVCQSASGNFKLTHTRPDKWEINKTFGEFDDSMVEDESDHDQPYDITGVAQPFSGKTGTSGLAYPSRGRPKDKTSTGLGFPDALFQGGRLHAPLRIKHTQGKGLLGLQTLSKYKRVAYKLYWIEAMLDLCQYAFTHLYLVQGVYIRTLGYPTSTWGKFFDQFPSITSAKFQGFITSEQKKSLTKAATDKKSKSKDNWLVKVWKNTVGRLSDKDEESFKTLMVFLSRKYPSKQHDVIHKIASTEEIIYATYNPSSLVKIENKLSSIAAAFNDLTPEEKERTLSQFDYIDYSIAVDLSGRTKTYNAQQYLAIFVANELKGGVSYIIQPFLELDGLVLKPTLDSDGIQKLINGPGDPTFLDKAAKGVDDPDNAWLFAGGGR